MPIQFSTLWTYLTGGIAFYTCLPIPLSWNPEFQGVARWAVWVGFLIGGLLGLLDWGLHLLSLPLLPRSALLVVAWIGITGGLHLDGAIDAADGLAVKDPGRRLAVMTESTTGAFGVMAAGCILLLKVAALTEIQDDRWLILMAVAGWGRWGQQLAIARYPYLKPTGLGAFHKQAIRSLWDVAPSLLLLLALSSVTLIPTLAHWPLTLTLILGGGTIAFLTGAWFNQKLGGHTGDTYGAVVEWTEALILCMLTAL
ncbi:MAG: adenosylcobinamide-GDP ribazoletransferase [Leptolyngbyaceae cyanobacterium bins.59]|nr:adenosylcobinamide-GDP ribazoletransferase [Leptolyngbyaceae cyanobacterium bins.59]